ncbi:MAG: endonuclease III domain-containing protein [Dehalococcoidales bacterium]|jgi:endonuclease-3 related protein|nr:endonuclease III domain-containing protein [Dehalococcoidales bacterium]MDX9986286.1 endonuclease III domain-containing protein [Dehalococcoidales bacterium]NLE90817.1 endonuclease III domain-containing protein [Dehalococcoidales bacterium]
MHAGIIFKPTKDNFAPNKLEYIYNKLFERYSHQHWWPGETPFEVMVGAVLTQSTSWESAARAIENLRETGNLNPHSLQRLPEKDLAALIKPSGYYNDKARKLKSLVEWLRVSCNYNLSLLNDFNTADIRQSLLSVHGIGPETADSILLYALKRPVFVIDAYTCRILSRIGVVPEGGISYDNYQRLFTTNLEPDTAIYNEYHALLVKHGKTSCKKQPLCNFCCIASICISYNSRI